MNELHSTARALFVEPFLVEPADPLPEPKGRYDEDRDLTVSDDGTPVVEVAAAGGTATLTKSTGERDAADHSERLGWTAGTLTYTAVKAEREDDDAPVAWGGTQLDTRRFPADIEQD